MGLINTAEALASIDIQASDIKRFAGNPVTRQRLIKEGVDPNCYYPETAKFISDEQWIRLLLYFEKKANYKLAKNILNGYRRIISQELYEDPH